MGAYQYTECGLDNVFLENMKVVQDDAGQKTYEIPNIKGLHKAIAHAIIEHAHSISGAELRFLRTELGYTQDELASVVHRDRQAIGHWERGEIAIDNNAEAIIRMLMLQKLGLLNDSSIEDVGMRCISGTKNQKVRIDASNPNQYRSIRAA